MENRQDTENSPVSPRPSPATPPNATPPNATPPTATPPTATPPNGARKFPYVRISLTMMVALIIAMVAWHWFVVRPWTAAPDIDPRRLAQLWERVEEDATVSIEARGPSEKLQRLLERLRDRDRREIERVIELWRTKDDISPSDRDVLQAIRDTGDHLVEWYQARGGLSVDDPCDADHKLGVLDLVFVGRLSLALADVLPGGPSTEDRITSVLYLAYVMRHAGGLDLTRASIQLALHAAGGARRMKALRVLREHAEWAPSSADVWRTLNVEAFCVDRQIAQDFQVLKKTGWPKDAMVADFPRSWIEPAPDFLARERRMLRAFWLDLLNRADGAGGDLVQMGEAIRLPSDPAKLPKSLIVRLNALDLSDEVIDMGRSIEEYRAIVDGREPSPSR